MDDFPLGDLPKWSWATTFEKEAMKLQGVVNALADREKKILRVEYDEGLINRAQIEEKLSEVLTRFKNKGFLS